jgi:hypothetical protein
MMISNLELSNRVVRHAVEDLEEVHGIPAIDKAHILLVANGNKPSMHSGFFSKQTRIGEAIPQSDIDILNMLVSILERLSLKYKLETKIFTETENGVPLNTTRTIFYIAERMDVVDRLIEAREKEDTEREGLLLGFPKSAVDAYARNDVIPVSNWPARSSCVNETEMKFLNHMISPTNWEAEVEYLPEYASITHFISPTIYDQIIKD